MEVVNARSALLSNFEVLNLLRELDAEHIARTKTAIRVKKEGEAAGKNSHDTHAEEISENLRTVELEAIQYLSADYQPTLHQSDEGITQLVGSLQPFGLSKSEKLQIVNLAPTEPVELYVIVEEVEDRLGSRMDDLLAVMYPKANRRMVKLQWRSMKKQSKRLGNMMQTQWSLMTWEREQASKVTLTLTMIEDAV
ncbi:hypothetical protein CY34DRAFT_798704 [Suillus luteus UH-Slu-Lm8-n1]|uniref:DNA-directed RNA polymerase III subunit RPC9 n=1 Tax=Suillus luteus UH-Slu-Lm8-n1 TaxID=930992 RepID=A0A0D0BZ63_9AGAM|nr:hypothetical protein CY34DRAFT_798704 [Suillus luteus UH-Slu-Lm8-n1]